MGLLNSEIARLPASQGYRDRGTGLLRMPLQHLRVAVPGEADEMTFHWRWVVVLLIAVSGNLPATTLADGQSPTAYGVAPVFQRFYANSGGVPIFGPPVSPPVLEDGRLVQYFERQRFEYHPELAGTGYEVLLGLLGREMAEREGRSFSPAPPLAGYRYVPETGHNIAPQFIGYWESGGGVRIFGYPVTEAFWEDGLLIQYFERARFEYRLDLSGTPGAVRLGALGRIAWQQRARDTQYVAVSLAQNLAALLNDARAEAGLSPFEFDATLAQVAQLRSNDMAKRGYFSHTSPEGTTVFDLLGQWGIPWRYAGETIQRNNFPLEQTAAEAARSLLASPPHRAIILDPRFTRFGVAEAVSADGIRYYTVILVQP